MGIRYKPTTPSRRGSNVADFAEVTRTTPEKSLVRPLPKKGGRNNSGHHDAAPRWRPQARLPHHRLQTCRQDGGKPRSLISNTTREPHRTDRCCTTQMATEALHRCSEKLEAG